MKISTNRINNFLLLWYPLLNLVICYSFMGDMMNTFSLLICGIIVFTNYKKLLKRKNYEVIWFWVLVTLCVSFVRDERPGITSCMLYSITCMILIVDAETDISKIRKIFIDHSGSFLCMQILFFGVLAVYVLQYGLTAGWDTYVLQGPYLYPHTLAYIILLMMMVDCYLWMNSKKNVVFLFIVICAGCIVLTAVRSVLIVVAITALYALHRLFDRQKFNKLLFSLLIGATVLAVAYRMGIFEIVVHKTNLALANSSITNGRGDIVLSSLKALEGDWILVKYFFGVGMDALQANNLLYYGADIHAHNDLIDVLICHGIPNLLIYIYLLEKFSRNNIIWFAVSLGILVLFNGLFPYIDCIPILLYSKILFDNLETYPRT